MLGVKPSNSMPCHHRFVALVLILFKHIHPNLSVVFAVIYMRFPHPKGNIPIRMRQRGQPGITIDHSTDTVSISDGASVFVGLRGVLKKTWEVLKGYLGASGPAQIDLLIIKMMLLLQPATCRHLLARAVCPPAGKKALPDPVLVSAGQSFSFSLVNSLNFVRAEKLATIADCV